MKNNISNAERALNDAATDPDATTSQAKSAAAIGIGEALVAIAKGLSVIGSVMYLSHIERARDGSIAHDAGIEKVDTQIREGLDLS